MCPTDAPAAIDINVSNFLPTGCPSLPVWTGVALPPAALTDPVGLRLTDPDGRAVPAQFDVLARRHDGSARWVLVSWLAAPPVAAAADGPLRQTFLLTMAGASALPQPSQPVTVLPDTHHYRVNTGPLEFLLNRHGFSGLGDVRLNADADGGFPANDPVCAGSPDAGIIALDEAGEVYTSGMGRERHVEIELPGPMHVCVAVHGDVRSRADGEPLLDYCLRVHAFAGSSLVRMVLTVHNPRPAGRAGDGARLVLGQSGSVFLRELAYVVRPRLPFGRRVITLSPEPGQLYDRIPLAGPMALYQDSSGGENWFHRTHVNHRNVVPLSFRGYRVDYCGRTIATGLRADPWIEVADMRWAVALAAPRFWQNFPKSLGADGDGSLRLGLWPRQAVEAHEIQGGEQKTHEFYLYFRHRRGSGDPPPPAYAREVLPACLRRPMVLASAESFAQSRAVDPMVPAGIGPFADYEAAAAASVRGPVNLFSHREQADEFGWRHYGDTPARNERDRTGGPYDGLQVVSHYNNEYDLGLTMLMQALRTADADVDLSARWLGLGLDALRHEADIDIYHTRRDLAPIYNGGTFTHTAHGVDAGRSTHRGGPRDEQWGLLDWPWGRGSTPEAGHVRTRGILLAYMLTGDRHLLDAAREVAELVAFKVGNDRFAQIDIPNRSAGHNLQVLLDAWAMTWEPSWLELCRKIVAELDWDALAACPAGPPVVDWSCAIYVRNLGRFIDLLAEAGMPDEGAIASFLGYARAIRDRRAKARARRVAGAFTLLDAEVLTQAAELADDAEESCGFLAAAAAAFGAISGFLGPDGAGEFRNSKHTTILLHGGGRYMRHVCSRQKAGE